MPGDAKSHLQLRNVMGTSILLLHINKCDREMTAKCYIVTPLTASQQHRSHNLRSGMWLRVCTTAMPYTAARYPPRQYFQFPPLQIFFHPHCWQTDCPLFVKLSGAYQRAASTCPKVKLLASSKQTSRGQHFSKTPQYVLRNLATPTQLHRITPSATWNCVAGWMI